MKSVTLAPKNNNNYKIITIHLHNHAYYINQNLVLINKYLQIIFNNRISKTFNCNVVKKYDIENTTLYE